MARNQISPYHELGMQDARIKRLEAALREIGELVNDQVDIKNSDAPNTAMRVQTIVRAALAR